MIKALVDVDDAVRKHLIAALNNDDDEVVKNVIYTLREMGPSTDLAAAHLGKTLASKDENVRKAAAYALAGSGSRPRPAAPSLIKALTDYIPSIRPAVAYAMGEGRLNHLRALSAIYDADDNVPEEIIFAISEIRTDEKPVIDSLQQALKNPSPVVRDVAQEAIDKVQGDDGESESPATEKATTLKL